jgi:hypothetical protein
LSNGSHRSKMADEGQSAHYHMSLHRIHVGNVVQKQA